MDTTNPTLKKVYTNLFDDLGKLGQLIEPCNDRALAILYQALNHLRDLEALIDPTLNLEFRKAQIEGGYSQLDIVDLLIDRLEGAEAICDMLSVVAVPDDHPGSELCDTTMHRAAFAARNLITECLEKTNVWSAQHSSREAS